MPTLNFIFSNPLNVSLQVGDTAYYVNTTSSDSFTVNQSSVIEIGEVTSISSTGFSCFTFLPPAEYPTSSDYILFTKDNKANLSSVLGYYAMVNIRNDSKDEAELFQISADYFDSSK